MLSVCRALLYAEKDALSHVGGQLHTTQGGETSLGLIKYACEYSQSDFVAHVALHLHSQIDYSFTGNV